MNVVGIMMYLYFGVLSSLLGLAPIYYIMKYFKLERDKAKSNAIIQYKENLKNLMPKAFRNMIISLVFNLLFICSFCIFVLKFYEFVIFMTIITIALMIFIGFYKFPVYVSNEGLYYNKLYTWKAFDGYEKIGNKIKLIGKKYTTSDVYLKDETGKLEEILKRHFKHYTKH